VALLLKLLNFSCSRCSFPSDYSDHFLVNINSTRASHSRRLPARSGGAATTLGSALAVDAARKAERIGYVAPKELVPIQTELCAWRPFAEAFPPVTK
jgi:hypothetical protein